MSTAPATKTMFNYFTKLPSKTCIVEEANPRKLAPVYNRQHVEEFQNTRREQFDAELLNNNAESHKQIIQIDGISLNYIASIRSGQYVPFKYKKKVRGPLRARLFQYTEDIRPPYFGTWQKRSKHVTGRRPLVKDDQIFDYDLDSEAEWDIGGPGESLRGDDSEDEEELDDYEIDMKTFVPHGYVSDDEVDAQSDKEEEKDLANQSIEPVLEIEDNSGSIQIIATRGFNSEQKEQPTNGADQQQRRQSGPTNPQSSTPQVAQAKHQKQEIKPITLGLIFEDQPLTISESKLLFLKAFQGISCG